VAENLSKAISSANVIKNYSHILHSTSVHGKNFFPRLAALNDASPVTDIIDVVSPDTVSYLFGSHNEIGNYAYG
jgi:electron transfer flavoprotein alpha subunit